MGLAYASCMCITIPFTSLIFVRRYIYTCSFLELVGGRRSKEVKCSVFRTLYSRNPITLSSSRGPHHLNPSEEYVVRST